MKLLTARTNCSLKQYRHKNCLNIDQCLAENALLDNPVICNSSDESHQSDSGYNSVDSINFELNPYLEENMLPITYGKFTRMLFEAWFQDINKNNEENYDTEKIMTSPDIIPYSNLQYSNLKCRRRKAIMEIQSKFHCIDLYPTESQVFEMIQFASNCERRRTIHSIQTDKCDQQDKLLKFGEFCLFATILMNNSAKIPQLLVTNNHYSAAAIESKSERAVEKKTNNNNDHYYCHRSSLVDHENIKFDIFLGGSCNPTRWRLDLVLPELKKNCITYYNPQVDHWGPELIELESYAKQHSEVLFFVIDNQTRAIASMIEVAFIAASRRKLILVIIDFEQWTEHTQICDDYISEEEHKSLRIGRQYLRDIVERQEIPIFDEINLGLRSAIQILQKKVWPQDLSVVNGVIPVKNGRVSFGDKMIKVHHVYDQSKNSNTKMFTFSELPLAYRMLFPYRHEVPTSLLEQFARCRLNNDLSSNSLNMKEIPIDFDEFCIIISELVMELAFKQNKELIEKEENNSQYTNDNENESETDFYQDSFNTTNATSTETDSDNNNYQRNIKKKKRLEKNIIFKTNEQSHGANRIFNKVQNITASILKSIGLDTTTNTTNQQEHQVTNLKEKNKSLTKKHRNKENKRLLPSNTQNNTKPLVNKHYNHNENYQMSEYVMTMRSSQSLSQLNDFNHQLSPINYSLNKYNHQLPYRNSVSPFRKSSSPRNIHRNQSVNMDQMIINSDFIGRQRLNRQQPSNVISSSQSSINSLYKDEYDLYLGGRLDNKLMQEKILPLLKKHSITYCKPRFEELAHYERMIPLEAINIEKCRQLLFVIPENSLEISPMIIAAHYVGLGYPVILCIQYIDSQKSELASKLSPLAIKDYNRGRSYLSDMATKFHVPVFDNIDEAIRRCIQCCSQK